ncbi:MAG: phospho-N-acetylmuramoyl-pentapeptide-transferase [Elusimicrobia bacterium RIFCSPLOWO2_01_FULL_64_13]|nr:MAG: phospho-N-acetylmuramoyl-pentapeptide-transferase [Elusimicrobia bacterium RIFCSPHIGHO2_01_FULL_64_10]OGR96484.1 MAG: phospho-N-acetylmuramoyl-pentapeptide-transferase [Elusimicrobia bacterium RIFCSPLOWO2_01_FULL_64_13]
MLYALTAFRDSFSPFNVLGYITFRMGSAMLTAFFLTWLLGPRFIAFIRAKSLTQTVRPDGPPTHSAKTGTPTMGGILILGATLASTLLWAKLDNRMIWLSIGSALYLGALGFVDDFIKWRQGSSNPKGISPTAKMLAQTALAVILAAALAVDPPNPAYASRVNVPYLKNVFLDLGIFYVFFAMLVIVGSSNAVNLTDGLDGLAIGSLVIACLTFIVFAYLAGHARFSAYLRVIPVPGAGELSVFLAAIAGAGLGFLWFNSYPADIFMGDTGSLFLGGSLGLVAVLVKQELILVVVGGLFVVEAASVLLQVYSFRLTGKRVFRMAPLHHHFELAGWKEPKVTVRFWIFSIVLSLIALSSLKLR